MPRPDRTPAGAERAAKVASIQKANKSQERRRGAIIWGAAALVIVLIIGAVAFAIVRDSPATADLSAVQEMDPGSADHVTDEVQYDPAATGEAGAGSTEDAPEESTDGDTATADADGSSTVASVGNPPTGGAHHPAWWDCGVYPEQVPAEHAVHSMEHGAVWLTYLPSLPAEQVAVLEELGQDEYMLVSPYAGQDAPVVATSWGHQLELETADEKTLKAFIREFKQGPDTPEPGAACTGGTTTDMVERP